MYDFYNNVKISGKISLQIMSYVKNIFPSFWYFFVKSILIVRSYQVLDADTKYSGRISDNNRPIFSADT